MIINLISGPRNISTALMYSFAQHSKIKVIDEPFYAYYLIKTGLDHPGREEIIVSMKSDPGEILDQIKILEEKHKIVFIKNMAHHHIGLDLSYLKEVKNVFLIRDPKQLIASFAQIINHPTLQDIGLKKAVELLDYVVKKGTYSPIIIDSNDVLNDPKEKLTDLCSQLEIPFEATMLKWKKGILPEDGLWAKYWYKNIHQSNGFTKQKTNDRPLPDHCEDLYNEILPYYEELKKYT